MKSRQRNKLLKQISISPVDAKGRFFFLNKKADKRQICRMSKAAEDGTWDDPYMRESGCSSEFASDWRRADRADGCPACIEAGMP